MPVAAMLIPRTLALDAVAIVLARLACTLAITVYEIRSVVAYERRRTVSTTRARAALTHIDLASLRIPPRCRKSSDGWY